MPVYAVRYVRTGNRRLFTLDIIYKISYKPAVSAVMPARFAEFIIERNFFLGEEIGCFIKFSKYKIPARISLYLAFRPRDENRSRRLHRAEDKQMICRAAVGKFNDDVLMIKKILAALENTPAVRIVCF